MKLRLTIEIDSPVVGKLEDQARHAGIPLETLISKRLASCQDHVSTRSLYFSDPQRQELEKLIGRNVSSPEELLAVLRSALSLTLDGRPLQFKPDLLYRLQGRNLAKVPFVDFVQKTAVEELERYCEMR